MSAMPLWFGPNWTTFSVFSGSVDGNNQLIIRGRFNQKQIENVLRRYISKYCYFFSKIILHIIHACFLLTYFIIPCQWQRDIVLTLSVRQSIIPSFHPSVSITLFSRHASKLGLCDYFKSFLTLCDY